MTGSSDKGGKKGPDEPASDARAPEGLEDLMTNPAAAMAAATAFGFGMAAQMGKLFLGSIQGAMEVTGQIARQLEEERKAAEAKPAAEPEVKAEAPVVKVEPAPAPAKVKSEKGEGEGCKPGKTGGRQGGKAESGTEGQDGGKAGGGTEGEGEA